MELRPIPFEKLLVRAFEELRTKQAIFDLPARRFWKPAPGLDLSVVFRQERAATPAGPAAGPQSQLVSNIVLSWLSGGRVMELKTVQVDDRLVIPRPCIDARTVGYNVEWSQELRVEDALEEYVAAWMFIHFLEHERVIDLPPGTGATLFDMSVGYDLAGIRTDKVTGFIRAMLDATPVIERLRTRLTGPLARFRDVPVPARVAAGITLSTFHGCPADEIEAISRYLLEELGVHCIVKLNPTLLGFDEVEGIVRGKLGYKDIFVQKDAFDHDLKWDQCVAMVERLTEVGRARGLTFGVKTSNTLVVENRDKFFSDKMQYLSGAPLHVLTSRLAARVRERFPALPISFSAGVDAKNYHQLVACDLAPVTSCTDLLRAGGYARMTSYLETTEARMKELGVKTRADHVVADADVERAAKDTLPEAEVAALVAHVRGKKDVDVRAHLAGRGLADRHEALVARAGALALAAHAARVLEDPRYAYVQNAKPPRKIGSRLWLFDCVNCDKCIQVCPNDANFALDVTPFAAQETQEVHVVGLLKTELRAGKPYKLAKTHQLANFADFCNECGNCDVFCPEDGGPYVLKPRFFGSKGSYLEARKLDGFYLERIVPDGVRIVGRIDGIEHSLVRAPGAPDRFEDDACAVEVDRATGKVLSSRAFFRAPVGHVLQLWRYVAVRAFLEGIEKAGATTPVGAGLVRS